MIVWQEKIVYFVTDITVVFARSPETSDDGFVAQEIFTHLVLLLNDFKTVFPDVRIAAILAGADHSSLSAKSNERDNGDDFTSARDFVQPFPPERRLKILKRAEDLVKNDNRNFFENVEVIFHCTEHLEVDHWIIASREILESQGHDVSHATVVVHATDSDFYALAARAVAAYKLKDVAEISDAAKGLVQKCIAVDPDELVLYNSYSKDRRLMKVEGDGIKLLEFYLAFAISVSDPVNYAREHGMNWDCAPSILSALQVVPALLGPETTYASLAERYAVILDYLNVRTTRCHELCPFLFTSITEVELSPTRSTQVKVTSIDLALVSEGEAIYFEEGAYIARPFSLPAELYTSVQPIAEACGVIDVVVKCLTYFAFECILRTALRTKNDVKLYQLLTGANSNQPKPRHLLASVKGYSKAGSSIHLSQDEHNQFVEMKFKDLTFLLGYFKKIKKKIISITPEGLKAAMNEAFDNDKLVRIWDPLYGFHDLRFGIPAKWSMRRVIFFFFFPY